MSGETAAFTLYRNCYGEYVQPYDAIQTETTEVIWRPDGIEVVTRPIDYDSELRARVLKEVCGVDVEIFDARIHQGRHRRGRSHESKDWRELADHARTAGS
jgi:hypothetical protein